MVTPLQAGPCPPQVKIAALSSGNDAQKEMRPYISVSHLSLHRAPTPPSSLGKGSGQKAIWVCCSSKDANPTQRKDINLSTTPKLLMIKYVILTVTETRGLTLKAGWGLRGVQVKPHEVPEALLQLCICLHTYRDRGLTP